MRGGRGFRQSGSAVVISFRAVRPLPSHDALASLGDGLFEVEEVVRAYVPFRRKVLAVTLGLSSVGLAVVGLMLNMSFAYSLGRTEGSGDLLATIGIVLDVLTLILPAAGALLCARVAHLAPSMNNALAVWDTSTILTPSKKIVSISDH